jgi:hypothetical protein
MRYLNKREDFLREKNSNSINKIRSINEASEFNSGPFANDVGWNDSLLGRLINHIIRKARIARKVGQIKKLIERLQEQFDYLVDQSTVFSLGDDSQLLLLRITLSSFFKELIFAVENGRPVSELIGLTDGAIKAVNDVKELDKKDVLLEELKKFREFLNQFKDEESTTDEESTDTATTTYTTGLSDSKLFDLMFKNLEALKNIIYYKDVVKKNVEKPTFKVGDIVMFTNAQKKKNKVKILSLDHQITAGVDKIFLTKDDGPIAPEPKVNIKPNLFVVYVDASGNPIKNSKNVYAPFPAKPEQLTIESIIFEKDNLQYRNPVEKTRTNTIGNKSGANIDRNNIFKGEDPHLTQSLDNLKKAIDGLIGSQNQPPITIDFINNILANKLDNRKVIKSLYKEVNEFMVGKYKLSDLGPLYKEGIGVEYLTKRNQLNMVAKKIALFAKRALQFNGENMYGGLGDLGKHLKIFVDTLIPLTKATINEGVDILGYNSFLEAKNILPSGTPNSNPGATAAVPQGGTASGDAQGKEGDDAQGKEGGDQSKKILEFFNQTCIEVRAFTATDEEISKLREELEAKKKEGGEVIMSMDPIIEIMNLFIKAYKLYTVQTITKRSEKVDTNTLSEYTSFGGNSSDGGDSGRNGPYRNNKLFDAWEEGVNEIRKNRKYQVFFTKNAKLRLPTVPDPNPAKADDWEIKDNAGINFNRFINDILDGEKLYKSGSERGKVAVFVDSYFGEGAVTKNGEGAMATLDEKDLTDAATLENSKQKLSLELGKINPALKGVDLKANTIFTITYKNEDDVVKQRTFLIHEVSGGNVYMSYTLINYYKNKYLNRMNGTQKDILKGAFPVNLANDGTLAPKYTMVKVNEFDNIFKPNNTITVSSVDNDGTVTSPVFKGISEIYWLVYTENKKIYTIDDTTEPKLANLILQAGNKPCKTTVNSKSGIQIKKS